MSSRAEIRMAHLDDVPAIRAILAAHDNDGPVEQGDVVGPYVRHLLSRARALVATEAGVIVAFAAVVDAGVAFHLADFFVRPDRLGRGIGGPLLAAVFAGDWPRTTFASNDPRAFRLYVGAGMLPYWPLCFLEGTPDRLPPAPPTVTTAAAAAGRLASLESAWSGVERQRDHAFWGSLPEADSFVVLDEGEPVAIAHARVRQAAPVRVLDRMVVRPSAEPVTATLAAIHRAASGGRVVASIPGPNPALGALLDAGFRLIERDTFMASEPARIDPTRLVPNSGLL